MILETRDALDRANAVLDDGGVVVVPTRTNYCLVCDPENPEAIEKVFAAKQRSKFGPLTLALHDIDAASRYAQFPAGFAPELLHQIWPSEVSFILPLAYDFPQRLTMGAATVAIMYHRPCGLQRLLERRGSPLGLTSGNLSGQGDIRIDLAKTVQDLGDRVDLVVGAVRPEITISSTAAEYPSNTIVDLSFTPPRLVREGVHPSRELLPAIPDLILDASSYSAALQARLAGAS